MIREAFGDNAPLRSPRFTVYLTIYQARVVFPLLPSALLYLVQNGSRPAMDRIKAGDDCELQSAVLQIKDAKRHLLMLLASYNRASKALEKSALTLSECRQLLLQAEKLLAEREMSSGKPQYRSRTIAMRIVARSKKQRDLKH
jgi:hypothetical protein